MSDLYAAIRDSAINKLINVVMTTRPDLFNYAAPSWKAVGPIKTIGATEVFLSCKPPQLAPGLDSVANPLFTRVPWLPAPGLATGSITLQIPWCFQITAIKVDFEPTDQITTLPPELSPPLSAQHFGFEIDAWFGVGCPPPAVVQSMIAPPTKLSFRGESVIPVDKLQCFSLQLYATGHFDKTETGTPPADTVQLTIDNIELVDLSPDGLESAIECYLETLIKVVVQPQLQIALAPIPPAALGLPATISPKLATDVPVNPAIEQNEVRVWVNVTIT